MASGKMTEKSQEALTEAQRLAGDAQNTSLEGVHLLQALLEQENGIVPLTLQSAGIDLRAVQDRAEQEATRLPKAHSPAQLVMSDELRRVVRQAEDEASRLKDDYISTEHLAEFKRSVVVSPNESQAGFLQYAAGCEIVSER